MHRTPCKAALARSIALVAAMAGGCFADPGWMGHGSDDAGATGTATSEPTGAAQSTGGPTDCGNAQLDPGEACDDGPGNGQDGNLCKADCSLNTCGDGYVAASETCDDGNSDDADDCNNACEPPRCGDGALGPGEVCDDGPANADDQACKLDCTLAVCGDGLVRDGVESCDDGDQDDGDGCSSQCTLESCGDGVVQPGEACDDGNVIDADGCSNLCTTLCGNAAIDPGEACDDGNILDGDTCSSTCERTAFLVFVTSQKFTGGLGGVAGADERCNTVAARAALPGAGKYRAWLSSPTTAPFDTFFHSDLPYRLPDGRLVADNWADMTTSSLTHAISVTETGEVLVGGLPGCDAIDSLVWTNTTQAGFMKIKAHCQGWTIAAAAANGAVGNALEIGPGWTDTCKVSCDATARLYCFEQP
jgi:cysteine-rich repeat protein